jgi:hypothetical protein
LQTIAFTNHGHFTLWCAKTPANFEINDLAAPAPRQNPKCVSNEQHVEKGSNIVTRMRFMTCRVLANDRLTACPLLAGFARSGSFGEHDSMFTRQAFRLVRVNGWSVLKMRRSKFVVRRNVLSRLSQHRGRSGATQCFYHHTWKSGLPVSDRASASPGRRPAHTRLHG